MGSKLDPPYNKRLTWLPRKGWEPLEEWRLEWGRVEERGRHWLQQIRSHTPKGTRAHTQQETESGGWQWWVPVSHLDFLSLALWLESPFRISTCAHSAL